MCTVRTDRLRLQENREVVYQSARASRLRRACMNDAHRRWATLCARAFTTTATSPLFVAFWHGYHIHHSAMTNYGNDTCKPDRDVILGMTHPRDVRLQIYISLTLGVGAFLLFCVRLLRVTAKLQRANQLL